MRAIVNIREQPSYRADAFRSGLARQGYQIVPMSQRGRPDNADDLLILWNIHRETEGAAADWEGHGGTVIVCENGYVGQDQMGRQFYAIAVHGHNGSGWHYVGSEDRFSTLAIPLKPFRKDGEHLLVCGQRGIGSREMASPANWHMHMADRLRKLTDRPIKLRLHPGNKGPAPGAPTLADDLLDAYACVVWSSSSGVKALIAGVPVFYDAPYWICSEGGARVGTTALEVKRDFLDRETALHRMSWAQWSVAEIEAGVPFSLIREHRKEAKWN